MKWHILSLVSVILNDNYNRIGNSLKILNFLNKLEYTLILGLYPLTIITMKAWQEYVR